MTTIAPASDPTPAEVERAVLGAMLVNGDIIPDVLARLRPEDFYYDAHRRVYAGILALSAAGTPADLGTLHDQLAASNDLADSGGPSYLAEIWVSAQEDWQASAEAVRRMATARAESPR